MFKRKKSKGHKNFYPFADQERWFEKNKEFLENKNITFSDIMREGLDYVIKLLEKEKNK